MSHWERAIVRKTAFEGPDFSLRQDRVLLENGRESRREVLCRPHRVMLLLEDPSGRILLERLFRPALEGESLELPCVPLQEGESPMEAARRLSEEKGGGPVWEVGRLSPSPALLEEKVFVFWGELCKAPTGTDRLFSREERGKIKDLRTAAALTLASLWKGRKDGGHEEG